MTSLLILLGVVLSSLSVYVQGELPEDFDMKKVNGDWYLIAYAYNIDKYRLKKVKVTLTAIDDGGLLYETAEKIPEGCLQKSYKYTKTLIHGVFANKNEERKILLTFKQTRENEYAYFEFNHDYAKESWRTRQNVLLTREKNPSEAVIEAWRKFVLYLKFKSNNIKVLDEMEDCPDV